MGRGEIASPCPPVSTDPELNCWTTIVMMMMDKTVLVPDQPFLVLVHTRVVPYDYEVLGCSVSSKSWDHLISCHCSGAQAQAHQNFNFILTYQWTNGTTVWYCLLWHCIIIGWNIRKRLIFPLDCWATVQQVYFTPVGLFKLHKLK